MNKYFNNLQSSDNSLVYRSLMEITSLIKSSQFELEPNFLFHLLIPLLNHNHYKIRSLSFNIIEYILSSYFSLLTDINITVPLFIFGLSSIKSNIVKSSFNCLSMITEYSSESIWQKDIHDYLIKGKSEQAKVSLLKIIKKIPAKFPLTTIIKLLDDPHPSIRENARTVLDHADPAQVSQALSTTKISYDAHEMYAKQYLISESVNHSKLISRSQKLEKEIKSESKIEDSKDKNLEMNKYINKSNNTDQILLKKIFQEQISLPSTEYQNHELRNQDEIQLHTSKNIEDNLNYQNHQKSSKKGSEFKFSNQIVLHFDNQLPPDSFNSINKIFHSEEENNNSSNYASETMTEIGTFLGEPKRKIKETLPFKLRNLSGATWLEKMEFLQMIKEKLNCGKSLSVTGHELGNCIMSCLIPVHKKTSPLAASVMTDLFLFYPEELDINLKKTLIFIQNATEAPAILNERNGLNELLNVILEQSNPDELIKIYLDLMEERKMYMEKFDLIYELFKRKDIELSRITSKRLLRVLITSKKFGSKEEELLQTLCNTNKSLALSFYQTQNFEIRKRLIKFLVETNESKQ